MKQADALSRQSGSGELQESGDSRHVRFPGRNKQSVSSACYYVGVSMIIITAFLGDGTMSLRGQVT